MKMPIPDRSEAGKALASELSDYSNRNDVIVLALPRGGVPVAWEIATTLGIKMDLILVRKLGCPGWSELAMGAIASGGIRVMNDDVIQGYGISQDDIDKVARRELDELKRRDQAYRGDRPSPDLANKSVILVDDGVATGATMFAAIDAVKQQSATEVIVAIPVAPSDTVARLSRRADKVICLATPSPFNAIGQWYRNFDQVSDKVVIDLLDRARQLEAKRTADEA